MTFDPETLRVLGALMEKEMTTPENYPLSLNALMAAANQKTSRDPVMNLSEGDVRRCVDLLEDCGLVSVVRDARVPKYEHRIRTVLNLRRDETAVLCLLLLRGAQTSGELRARVDRMFTFEEIAGVQAALDRLSARENPLVSALPRLAGTREQRSIHLLGDRSEQTGSGTMIEAAVTREDDLEALRESVRTLEERIRVLEARLEEGGD